MTSIGRRHALARLMPLVLGLAVLAAPARAAEKSARQLFGHTPTPADLQARAIGSYARGCLAGAVPLAIDGSHWQAMRLSRNRNWGHPQLVALVERLARDAAEAGEWPGLLVGDLSQPRGGPMLTGHRSHQIGLDADIWLTRMPDRRLSRQEREEIAAVSVLKEGTREIDPTIWTDGHAQLIRRAASAPEVARIFVHPAIKNQLCSWDDAGTGKDRAWLRKVRPWYGHHYHMHIRIHCPEDSAGCKNQDPPPAGDGCGKALAWWLGQEPWRPAKPTDKPVKPKPEMTLAGLPSPCRTVLRARAPDGSVPLFAAAGAAPGDLVGVPLPPSRPAIAADPN